MRLSKHQIQVLVALHLVIALMLMGIFLLPPDFSAPPVSAPPVDEQPEPYVHNKFRNARVGFSENISWELNLGGSGNDTVENTYEVNGRLLIVGRTESEDYDFDTSGGFDTYMMELNLDGTPVKYSFYEGRLAKSVLFNDAIVIFTETANEKKALMLSPDGDVILAKSLALKDNENIADIFFSMDDETINLVIALTASTQPKKKLKVLTLSRNLDSVDGAVLTHPYDLEYVAAYPHGSGFIIAANVLSSTGACMVIFEWKNGTQLLNLYDCSLTGRKYRAVSFLPYDKGYAALIIDSNNIPDILTVSDTSLRNTGLVLLNESETRDAAFYSDGTFYYAYLFFESGSSILYRLKSDMMLLSSFTAFSFHVEMTAFRCNTTDTFFGGRHIDMPVLSSINKQNVLFQTAFASSTEKIVCILPFKGYLIVICHSSGTSLDVGKNFGGTDIWVAKIKF